MKSNSVQKEQFATLRELGLRVTPLKEKILLILNEMSEPLSVRKLQILLRKRGLKPNKTSLYRELETLMHVKMIDEVRLEQGLRHFEIKKSQTDHHHHFVCEKCENIVDLGSKNPSFLRLEKWIQKMESGLKRKKFSVHSHSFNFYGLCTACKPTLP